MARPLSLWPPRAPSLLFLIFLIFYIFQNEQKVFLWNFWSWFTYRITYLFLFQDSRVLWKVSLIYSSGSITWIIGSTKLCKIKRFFLKQRVIEFTISYWIYKNRNCVKSKYKNNCIYNFHILFVIEWNIFFSVCIGITFFQIFHLFSQIIYTS